jgi:hypothetical protein
LESLVLSLKVSIFIYSYHSLFKFVLCFVDLLEFQCFLFIESVNYWGKGKVRCGIFFFFGFLKRMREKGRWVFFGRLIGIKFGFLFYFVVFREVWLVSKFDGCQSLLVFEEIRWSKLLIMA